MLCCESFAVTLQSLNFHHKTGIRKTDFLIEINKTPMKKLMRTSLMMIVLFAVSLQFSFISNSEKPASTPAKEVHRAISQNALLYSSLNLENLHLSRTAFDNAIKGYETLLASGNVKNENILSIIDFSLPSNTKRLFVIDLANAKLLFNTYVSHGRNSGQLQAQSFSNLPESFKSSLGFYVTSDTYNGKHGYSLGLDGKEPGFNDKALERGIVMHSANYVNEDIVKRQGYAGRSLGCPAVPENVYKQIIGKIKSGSVLFIYGSDDYYLSHSSLLNHDSLI